MARERTERHRIALLLGAAFLGGAQRPLGVGELDVGVIVRVVQVYVALLLVVHVGVEERILVVLVLRRLLQHRSHAILLVEGAHGHVGPADLILDVRQALVAAEFAGQARLLPFVLLYLGMGDQRRDGVRDEDRPVAHVLAGLICRVRYELPVFLRRRGALSADSLPPEAVLAAEVGRLLILGLLDLLDERVVVQDEALRPPVSSTISGQRGPIIHRNLVACGVEQVLV